MPSYPLTFPNISPQSVTWRTLNKTVVSESPYSGSEQTYTYDYQKWAVDFSFPPMNKADAQTLLAFLMELNGRQGTFTYGPTESIEGNAYYNGAVNGASQTGSSIISDGWPVNMIDLFKAGDKIKVNNYMHTILNDVDTDASGNATLNVWPDIRSISDDDVIYITNPTTTFRLTTGNIEYSIDVAMKYGITFSAMEVL